MVEKKSESSYTVILDPSASIHYLFKQYGSAAHLHNLQNPKKNLSPWEQKDMFESDGMLGKENKIQSSKDLFETWEEPWFCYWTNYSMSKIPGFFGKLIVISISRFYL